MNLNILKRSVATVLLFALILCCIPMTSCKTKGEVIVTDKNTVEMAIADGIDPSDESLVAKGYKSYVQLVMIESQRLIAALYDLEGKDAEKKLLQGGYTVKTAFDPAIWSAMVQMEKDLGSDSMNVGCAITDYDGNLCAVYSSGEQNYAATPQSPHSSFKPLSVYAPAMEKGIIDWSKTYVDMPYLSLDDGMGNYTDWPKNASGEYTGQKTTMYVGIQQSLNTMAVHCLGDLGVLESMRFLTENFGIDLSYEQSRYAVKGENEIIGNIALGSIYSGVTPIDMAGFYQIFGNLGMYEIPHTVLEIVDSEGNTVYEYKSEKKRIISEETAYVMNRLLMGVVDYGGTGVRATVKGIEVAGKTGTGELNESNWFVGLTPEYSCAVWHSNSGIGNIAPAMFSSVMNYMPEGTNTTAEFEKCPNIYKGVYCAESGLMFSDDCSRMQIGYYVRGEEPEPCNAH